MIISTRIFNQPNLVLKTFTMQSRIEAEESDTARDKGVCEYLKNFNFASRPRWVVNTLLENPEKTVAEALQLIGFGYWEPNQANLESVTDIHFHAYVCRDFSLLIAGWSSINSWPSIFDFIDSREYENFPAEHPIQELVQCVRQRFAVEHVLHWIKNSQTASQLIS